MSRNTEEAGILNSENHLNRFLFLTGLFASVSVIQIFGISAFLLFAYVYLFFSLLSGKFYINLHSRFLPFLLAATVSFFMPFVFNLPAGYIQNDLKGLINLFAIYFFASTILNENKHSINLVSFLAGLKWSCRIQVVWIIVQTISWNALSLDINELLFVNLFGFVEKASQFKGTGYVPTGLCWNAGGIAPVLFIGFFLENKLAGKLFIACGALLTQSATLTLGIALCISLAFFMRIKSLNIRRSQIKIKRAAILFCVLAIPPALFIFYFNYESLSQMVGRLWDVFSYRISGLFSGSSTLDSSTSAHLGYLVNLPLLLSSGPFSALLFGYGINCSGFHYSRIVGQYPGMVWIVECDLTNIVLNYGLIGLLFFYYWLISGLTVIRKHGALFCSIVVLMVMGLTYNLQYVWVIFFEMLVFDAFQSNLDMSRLGLGLNESRE